MAVRAAWGVGDQVFSSLTNFGLNILIARSLGASAFGAFSLAFSIFVIAISISRAFTSEPLVVRFSSSSRLEWARGAAKASGLSVLLGVIVGSLCVLAAQFMTGDLRSVFLGVGICMPGLLLQDLWRFSFFAVKRGDKSLLNDLVWALIMFPLLIMMLRRDDPDLLHIVLTWGGAATVAGLFGVVQARVLPSLTSPRAWLTEHRDLTPSYAGEMVTGSVSSQLVFFGIGAVASLAAVGAYRSAFVIFGPIRVLYQGLSLMGVSEAVRMVGKSTARLRHAAIRTSLVLASLAGAFGLFLGLMPNQWGVALLGTVWAAVDPLILPFTIGAIGLGMTMPVFIGMRAIQAAKRSFRTKLTVSSVEVVAAVVGASIGGAVGAAWAARPMVLLGSGLWWKRFGAELKRLRDSEPGSDGEVWISV